MPPKHQSKDLEEIVQVIEELLSTIQAQMEVTETRQTNIKVMNEFLQSSLTSVIDQVSSLPPPNFSPHIFTHDQSRTHTPPLPAIRPSKLQITFFEGLDPLD